jgi:hypothetical protein
VRLTSEEELADLKWEACTLWSDWTTFRELGERCECIVECQKPIDSRLSYLLRQQPFQDRFGIAFGLKRYFNAEWASGACR